MRRSFAGRGGTGYSLLPAAPGAALLTLAAFVFAGWDGAGFLALFSAALGGALVFYAFLNVLCSGVKLARAARAAKRAMQAAFLLWLVSFAVIESLVISNEYDDDLTGFDYIIVLGAGLRGAEPSLTLRTRLEAALSLLKENEDMKAVVSGGRGANEAVTEAEAMKGWLVRGGVEPGRIYEETRASDTEENIDYSLEVISGVEGERAQRLRIGVVTNSFHLYRARLIMADRGLGAFGAGAPNPLLYLRVTYHLREYFSLLLMWLGF